MAQPLENRITAALRDSSRLKDVEATISDVGSEIGSARKALSQELARSVDPALTTPQARQARSTAADLEHDIRRLEVSLSLLGERRQAILDDESYAIRLKRYEAAESERDALVAWVRDRYSVIVLEIVDMVQRLHASDAECAAVNRDRPRDKPVLVGAEFLGRDLPPSGYWPIEKGGSPGTRLDTMILPMPFSDEMAVPIPEFPRSPARWEIQMADLRLRLADKATANA
jgi:hypothetical protein